MAAVKFQPFVQSLGRGAINWNSDTLKVALSDVAPSVANAVLADITQISAGNGYSSGGATVAATAYSQTAGVGKLTGTDVTFTATGGSIATFRYIMLYDSTASGGVLMFYVDIGAETTITVGNSFLIHWDATNGIAQLQ